MDTLYHYCSVESFFAILTTRTVRLSDVAHMNDSHENHWADRILNTAIRNFKTLSSDDIDALYQGYRINKPHPFIFCLSSAPDTLSQWRGYADDATGVAIGFSAELFPRQDHLPSTNFIPSKNTALKKVLYEEKDQIELFQALLGLLYTECAHLQGDERRSKLSALGSTFSGWAPIIKNPAFHEEQEWRLIHTPLITTDDQNAHYLHGTDFELKQIASKKQIFTFFEYPLVAQEGKSIVKNIWLGPKCILSQFDLKLFLSIHNYGNIPVYRSNATYR